MQPTTVRPIGVYVLSGLAVSSWPQLKSQLLTIDTVRGYLIAVNPDSNQTTILNPYAVSSWTGATGLAVRENDIWFTKGSFVCHCSILVGDASDAANGIVPSFELSEPSVFAELSYKTDGVALWDDLLYVTSQKSGDIFVYSTETREQVGRFRLPGVGVQSITATETALWLCDRDEQSVFCLDRESGDLKFSAITPFSNPVGIVFYSASSADSSETDPTCYVAYADEEAYIRDDPNSVNPHQLTFRDRTFIHPLFVQHNASEQFTRSNGYLMEVEYVEELLPLEGVPTLRNVEWRMALPSDTDRQKVRSVVPIGHSFVEEMQEGQRVAVFRFDELKSDRAGLVGWKALVEMYSIKYNFTPRAVESVPGLSAEFEQRYLVDDDELAMDTPVIQKAAREAVGSETNILRKALSIRNYVYDKLSYGIQPKIDTPDVALMRGVGSCGEYVGLLLALFRLNGIACRTVGRYKCPQKPELRDVALSPDYNHVWLEFYVPEIGWLPMESNVDDIVEGGPYPQRFFMGLAWYHSELGKGIPFGKLKADNRPERFSVSDLAINHIRFTVKEELDPTMAEVEGDDG